MTFQDQVVFITGGARGQGRSHALAFARRGANIVLCDVGHDVSSVNYALGSTDELKQTQADVEATGVRCLTFEVDVRDADQLRTVASTAMNDFGRIDVACANAGIFSSARIIDMETSVWQDMIDINLTGIFNTARAVVPHMLEAGYGRFIATASMAGRGGFPNISHYAASKWGLIGFVKSLAAEVAGTGVTANVVAPTNVDTDMIQNQSVWDMFAGSAGGTRERASEVCASRIPLHIPWIQPEDVSRAVLYLADSENSMITGEVLHISAGVVAGNIA